MADNFFKISKGATLAPQAAEPTGQNGDLYYNSALNKFRRFENGNWKNMGGEGSGFKNILSEENSKFESGLSNWVTYNDSAAQPVDGTGGTASNLTISATTVGSEVLEGLSTLKIAKGAANAQGQGASVASLTIDREDRGKPFFISLSVDASHANYRYGDMQLYAYDITNGKLLTVYNNNGNGLINQGKGRVDGIIYTEDTTQQVRFIIHTASTNATAYDVFVDSVVITPQANVVGPIITMWQDFANVAAGTLIKGSTSNPTYGNVVTNRAQWRRVGQNLEIKWDYRQTSAGVAGSGAYLFDISQLGLTIDTTRVKANSSVASSGGGNFSDSQSVGVFAGAAGTSPASLQMGAVSVFNNTQLKVQLITTNSSAATDMDIWYSGGPGYHFAAAADISYSISASVPILGWDQSSVMSQNDAGLQSARLVVTTTTTTGAAATPYVWTNVVEDNYNGYNASTGQYRIPATGTYDIEAMMKPTATATQNLRIRRNGATLYEGLNSGSIASYPVSGTAFLYKDDLIDITASGAMTGNGNATQNYMSIKRRPDFNVFGVQGPIVVGAMTNEVSAGPVVFGATTTAPTKGTATIVADKVTWRRDGQFAVVRWEYAQTAAGTATAGSGDYLFPMPNGLQIDLTNIVPFTTIIGNNNQATITNKVGDWSGKLPTVTAAGAVVVYDANNVRLITGATTNGGVAGAVSSAFSPLTNATTAFMAEARVPIQGWSAETRLYPTQRVIGTTYLKDVKASGTTGGTFTAGAWQTRTLNTQEGDTGFCSLSSNQFTLQPGTYEIQSFAPAFNVASNASKLRNITDSTDVSIGSAQAANSNNVSMSIVHSRVTITSQKTFEIQHYCSVSNANGFGAANSFGVSEVYTQVKIEKIY